MAYRDHPPTCPRCGLELARRQRRDIWCCPRCAGLQLAAGELARRLRLRSPNLSEEVIRHVLSERWVRTGGRGARAPAASCPTCRRPMHLVALCGVLVARCDDDDQIWLDAAQFERVVEGAGARHQWLRSWLTRLFSHLFAS